MEPAFGRTPVPVVYVYLCVYVYICMTQAEETMGKEAHVSQHGHNNRAGHSAGMVVEHHGVAQQSSWAASPPPPPVCEHVRVNERMAE